MEAVTKTKKIYIFIECLVETKTEKLPRKKKKKKRDLKEIQGSSCTISYCLSHYFLMYICTKITLIIIKNK